MYCILHSEFEIIFLKVMYEQDLFTTSDTRELAMKTLLHITQFVAKLE